MLRMVSDKGEFQTYKLAITEIIDKRKQLPNQIFNHLYKNYLFITFDEILMADFFKKIKEYAHLAKDSDFWLSVIDPDPEEYFFQHFKRYSILVFNEESTEKQFISALTTFPKENLADSIMHNSNTILVSSSSGKWAIFGDRELDIGICAFTDDKSRDQFKGIYEGGLLKDVTFAAEYIYGAEKENLENKMAFYANYSDR